MAGDLFNPKLFDEQHWSRNISDKDKIRLTNTLENVPRDIATVLDVGCGDGRFSEMLKQSRPELNILATDYNTSGLKKIKGSVLNCSSTHIPCRDNSFDCVILTEVLEHLPNFLLEPTLREVARVSNKYILITVPYDEHIQKNNTQCPKCGHIFNINGHVQRFDKTNLASRIKDFRTLKTVMINKKSELSYNNFLLLIKQKILKLWSWSPDLVCPECDNRSFDQMKYKKVRNVLGVLNVLLQLNIKKATWMLLLLKKKTIL